MAGCLDRTLMNMLNNIKEQGYIGNYVDGHKYVLADSEDINIEVLWCRACGHVDIAWKYNEVSMFEQARLRKYYKQKFKKQCPLAQ